MVKIEDLTVDKLKQRPIWVYTTETCDNQESNDYSIIMNGKKEREYVEVSNKEEVFREMKFPYPKSWKQKIGECGNIEEVIDYVSQFLRKERKYSFRQGQLSVTQVAKDK